MACGLEDVATGLCGEGAPKNGKRMPQTWRTIPPRHLRYITSLATLLCPFSNGTTNKSNNILYLFWSLPGIPGKTLKKRTLRTRNQRPSGLQQWLLASTVASRRGRHRCRRVRTAALGCAPCSVPKSAPGKRCAWSAIASKQNSKHISRIEEKPC